MDYLIPNPQSKVTKRCYLYAIETCIFDERAVFLDESFFFFRIILMQIDVFLNYVVQFQDKFSFAV